MTSNELYPNALFFEAISSLKVEVASLASNLHLVEERVCRLEIATFTPPASPIQSQYTEDASMKKYEPGKDMGGIRSGQKQDPTPDISDDRCLRSGVCAQTCDVESHLKPIKDGIIAITEHLARLDQLATKPSLEPRSEPEVTQQDSGPFVGERGLQKAKEVAVNARNPFNRRQYVRTSRRYEPPPPLSLPSPPLSLVRPPRPRTPASQHVLQASLGHHECANSPFCVFSSKCHPRLGRPNGPTLPSATNSGPDPFRRVLQLHPDNPWSGTK